MTIIKPSVEIVREKDPYKKIELCSRTCYKSEGNITDDSAKRMFDNLVKNGHTAMLEHYYVVFQTNLFNLYNKLGECKFVNRSSHKGRFLVSCNLRTLYEDKSDGISDLLDAYKSGGNFLIDVVDFESLEDKTEEEILSHRYTTMRFTTNRGCCYSDDTSVLTKDGWKLFSQCSEQDEFLTCDDSNNLLYLKPNKLVRLYYNGFMHKWNSKQIDLCVTPNHNMWVFDYMKRSKTSKTWKFIQSQDCKNKIYGFSKCSNNTKENIATITIPALHKVSRIYEEKTYDANDLLELMGWWVTDGFLSYNKKYNGGRLSIVQKKEFGVKRIKFLLEKLNIPFSYYRNEFRINDAQLFEYLSNQFILNGDTKKTYYVRVPRWICNLGAQNIKSFLNGVIGGDGSKVTGTDQHQIYTASYGFAQDLVELFLLSGQSANIRRVEGRTRTFPNGHTTVCREQFIVNTVSNRMRTVKKNTGFSEEFYSGDVWCAELPAYHRLYVMRNGKPCWCGNSHEIVRHRVASFAQESTRYVNYSSDKHGSGDIKFIEPADWDTWSNSRKQKYIDSWENAEKAYNMLIEDGATPQEARAVLPIGIKTEIVMTANDREWRHFFNLRSKGTTGKPHPDMKRVADMALELYEKEYNLKI